MKNKYRDFLSILNIEDIDFIITDSDFSIVNSKCSSESILQGIELGDLVRDKKAEKIGENILYTPEITVFKYENIERFIFIDNKSLTEKFSNYLMVFNNLINTIQESIIIVDDYFNIEFVNSVFMKRYEYSEDDIRETLLTELYPPEFLETIINGLKVGDIVNADAEMYDGKGDTQPVKMKIMQWGKKHLIIVEDKQEKELYSREIEGLKKMQKLIFDSIAQGIVVLDKRANVIQFNKFMTQEYKFNKDLIGANIFEIVPDMKANDIDKIFVEIIEQKKIRKLSGVMRYSKRMKKELFQNFIGYPLIEHDKAIGVVVVIEDLTEKKRLEDEFESSKKKNEIANKLNSILSKGLELDYVLKSVSSYISEFLDIKSLYAYNSYAKYFIKFNINNNGDFKGDIIEESETMINAINKLGIKEPVIIKDKNIISDIISKKSIKEIIIMPIIFNNNNLGVMVLENKKSFDEKKVRMFVSDISDFTGYILDKSIIYEEKKSNLLKLELTLKISRLVSQSRNFEKTFENLLNIISQEINSDNSLMLMRNVDYKSFVSVAMKGRILDEMNGGTISFSESEIPEKISDIPILIKDTNKNSNSSPMCRIFGKKSKSIICVPVKFKNDILGVFVFAKDKINGFSQSDFDIIKIIATSSSSYIKNIHLQMQMEEKIDQLSILYKMTTSIRPVINLTFLRKAIVSSLGSITKAEAVLFLRKQENMLKLEAEFYNAIERKGKILKTNELEQRSISKFPENAIFSLNERNKIIKEQFNGIKYVKCITVKNSRENFLIMIAYKEKINTGITDETFLAIINELSIALENATLFGENEQRLKQFSSISAITKKLAQYNINNLDEYYQYIVDAAKELVGTEYSSLLLLENKKMVFKSFAGIDLKELGGYTIAPGEGVAGYVVKSGKPVIVNDTAKSKYFKKLDLSRIYEVRNLVNIPLIYKGNIIGVLCADNKKSGNFTENDVNLMKILANSTIIAFEHFMDIELGRKLSDVILDNIPSGIVYIEKSGLIQHINKGFSNISGYEQKHVFNIPYNEIISNDFGIIGEALSDAQPVLRREIELKKMNGQIIPCGISITPVKWDKKNDIVCIIQDISEIKKMRQELKEKENLALLGQMAAGMAHEIKNPLAGILTGLEFLHMQIDSDNDTQKHSIELVIKEVKRLDRLVNDMTSFAKSKIRIISKVKIPDIIDRAVLLTKSKLDKSDIKLTINISDQNSFIEADEEQILEVLINLLLNANQAIIENGSISITVKQDKEWCSLIVMNDGPHIPDDAMSNIFNPFFTTKSGGTGLGLSISYNIVKEHGGKLYAENVANGVAFTIILPVRAVGDNEE